MSASLPSQESVYETRQKKKKRARNERSVGRSGGWSLARSHARSLERARGRAGGQTWVGTGGYKKIKAKRRKSTLLLAGRARASGKEATSGRTSLSTAGREGKRLKRTSPTLPALLFGHRPLGRSTDRPTDRPNACSTDGAICLCCLPQTRCVFKNSFVLFVRSVCRTDTGRQRRVGGRSSLRYSLGQSASRRRRRHRRSSIRVVHGERHTNVGEDRKKNKFVDEAETMERSETKEGCERGTMGICATEKKITMNEQ